MNNIRTCGFDDYKEVMEMKKVIDKYYKGNEPENKKYWGIEKRYNKVIKLQGEQLW